MLPPTLNSCNTEKHNLRNPNVNLQNGVKVVKIKNEWCRLKPDRNRGILPGGNRGILPGVYLYHDWYKCYNCDFEADANSMTLHNMCEYNGKYPPMSCPATGCGKSFCTEYMVNDHSKRTHGKSYIAIIQELRQDHPLNCNLTNEGKHWYGTCPKCNEEFQMKHRNKHFIPKHPEIGKEGLKSLMPTMQELTEIIRAEFDIVPILRNRYKNNRAKRAKLSERPSSDEDNEE